MELSFSDGKFVSFEGELNYKEVLEDFPRAKIIRILTYNISKNQKNDALMEALKKTEADIQLITNVPSRMEVYYNSDAGMRMRSTARKNIQAYISKLNPENFSNSFSPYFNVHNHAKLIGTENIVYIGSANYSNESADNIETGVVIRDKEFIKKLYAEFFDEIKDASLSYFDENFSAFRLFILSIYAKFKHHHHKLLTDLYTDYERTELVVSDSIFIEADDLDSMFCDLDELESIFGEADDTYDDENDAYNDALEQLKKAFSRLDIEWLKEMVSEGSSLYKLVTYDSQDIINSTLDEHAMEAYDEHLDFYVDMALDQAAEVYSSLHDDFQEESSDFLSEIERVISALEEAIRFTDSWKEMRINPEIDNT